MERAVTTDELISIEAVKMNIGWMRIAEGNSFAGVCNLLKIDPQNDAEIDLVSEFMMSEMSVMDLLGQLKVRITDGKEKKEDQLEGQGGSSGEGASGGTESNTGDFDEEN